MERRTTPVSTSPDALSSEREQIHDTQNSLESAVISAERARTQAAEDSDTLLSGPRPDVGSGPEVDGRLDALQAQVSELSARVRLLEKASGGRSDGVRWLVALMFFVLLAVTWQLLSSAR